MIEHVALVFSILAFIFSVINLIELRAQQKSTHSVQLVPADQAVPRDQDGFEILTDEVRKKLTDDGYDNL